MRRDGLLCRDVRFDDGTAANRGNDVAVEVKGRLAPDGVTVQAFEIEFDDRGPGLTAHFTVPPRLPFAARGGF